MTFNLILMFTLTFWFFCYFDVRYLLWWQSPWYHVECIWGKLYFSTCLRFRLKLDPLFWDREALQMRYELSVCQLLLLWSQASLCQSLSQLLWFCSNKWSSSWRLRSYVDGRKPLGVGTRRFSPHVKVLQRAWRHPRMWHSTECSFFHLLHLTLWSRRHRIVVQVWIGFHPFFITHI